jgi:hypothetical protein
MESFTVAEEITNELRTQHLFELYMSQLRIITTFFQQESSKDQFDNCIKKIINICFTKYDISNIKNINRFDQYISKLFNSSVIDALYVAFGSSVFVKDDYYADLIQPFEILRLFIVIDDFKMYVEQYRKKVIEKINDIIFKHLTDIKESITSHYSKDIYIYENITEEENDDIYETIMFLWLRYYYIHFIESNE